jgi:cytochrome P450
MLVRDEDVYDNPMEFYPERFLNEDINKPLAGHWGFGAGRRVCAGYFFATRNLWIAMAKLIYCFDVEHSSVFQFEIGALTDRRPKQILRQARNTYSFLHRPLPFKSGLNRGRPSMSN